MRERPDHWQLFDNGPEPEEAEKQRIENRIRQLEEELFLLRQRVSQLDGEAETPPSPELTDVRTFQEISEDFDERVVDCDKIIARIEASIIDETVLELTDKQATVLQLLARTPKVRFDDVTVNSCETLQKFGCIGFAEFHRDEHGYWSITPIGRAALKAHQEGKQS